MAVLLTVTTILKNAVMMINLINSTEYAGTCPNHKSKIRSVYMNTGRAIIPYASMVNWMERRITDAILSKLPFEYCLIICGLNACEIDVVNPLMAPVIVSAILAPTFATTPKNIFNTIGWLWNLKVVHILPYKSNPENESIPLISVLSITNLNFVSLKWRMQ